MRKIRSTTAPLVVITFIRVYMITRFIFVCLESTSVTVMGWRENRRRCIRYLFEKSQISSSCEKCFREHLTIERIFNKLSCIITLLYIICDRFSGPPRWYFTPRMGESTSQVHQSRHSWKIGRKFNQRRRRVRIYLFQYFFRYLQNVCHSWTSFNVALG